MPGPPGPNPTFSKSPPPKVGGTGSSFNVPLPSQAQKDEVLATDDITTVFQGLMWSVGKRAPHHVNRTQTAIASLRRFGG